MWLESMLPVRYILEASPDWVSSHWGPQDIEPLPKLQLVSELLYIQCLALYIPLGVWVTFPIPSSIKSKEVNSQFFHKLLNWQKKQKPVEIIWTNGTDFTWSHVMLSAIPWKQARVCPWCYQMHVLWWSCTWPCLSVLHLLCMQGTFHPWAWSSEMSEEGHLGSHTVLWEEVGESPGMPSRGAQLAEQRLI